MPTRTAMPLEEVLGELIGAVVDRVEVHRSDYSTSFPIDVLTVHLGDGTERELVRKDLLWSALLHPARRTKPEFVYEPRREMRVYTDVLPAGPSGPATCFGVVDRPDVGRRWLFLERVPGVELFQVGDLALWEAAARWAAQFHVTFEGRGDDLRAAGVPLLVHDRQWLMRWADRAAAAAGRNRSRATRHLRDRCGSLWVRIAAQPATIVHGELYASNVIVSGTLPQLRVTPVDWEMAAVGSGLVDLAALTAGNWNPDERHALEVAYAAAAGRDVDDAFVAELDACRLALCLQWLGWKRQWRAPAEHSFDWFTEAMALCDRLEL